MASQGPLLPSTIVDDSTIGTVTWSNPGNAGTSDNTYATADVSNGPAKDNSVKLVKGGVISGDDKSLGNAYTTTDTAISWGNSASLWGLTFTDTDINASDFGVAIGAKSNDGTVITHYLKATNFGFSIPSGAAVTGILVTQERSNSALSSIGKVDNIQITVYYITSSASPSVSVSVSPSVSTSLSPSLSPSVSLSVSPSQSPSASISPSVSPSLSPSVSPSVSPSISSPLKPHGYIKEQFKPSAKLASVTPRVRIKE